MPAAARSLLIAGYYGFGNAGDEAILAGVIADLRSLSPDLEIVVASGDPAATEEDHGVRAVGRNDLPAVAAAVRASGLVIVGGGGLFQDYWEVPQENVFTPRSGGLPFYAGFCLLAALSNRPALFYAVGVGPLRTEEGRKLTRIAFELCQGATVRDPESLALLVDIGATADGVDVAADPAFGLAPAAGERLRALLSGVGLEEGERPVGIALRPWPFGPDPELWEAEVAAGLDRYLAAAGNRLFFLPFAGEEDVQVHRRVQARMAARGRAILVERRLAPAELAALVGRCERVLAMRYHAALFALAAGVPTAALAYDPKVRHLLAAAGLAELALPPEEWRPEAVADLLRGAREPAAAFGEEMRRRARKSPAMALEILERGLPELSEGERFLRGLAAGKALAAFRLEADSAERGALIDAQRGALVEREGRIVLLAEQAAALVRRIESLSHEREQLGALAEAQLESAGAKAWSLEEELTGLRQQCEVILAERNDLDRRLSALERTLAYRSISRFWRLMRRWFPEGSRRRHLYRFARRVLGKALGASDPAVLEAAWKEGMGGAPAQASQPAAEAPPDPRADLLRFEERVRGSGATQMAAIFSATQLLESEGQRPTQLALAMARRGIPVVFVYWRWWDNEWRPQDRAGDGILQIPIDVVTKRPEMVTGAFRGLERIALFEFPHPGFFETLAVANSAGWTTVYDALDDWEEFHRVGQAIWYDEPFERQMIGACDAVFAINEVLAGRIRGLGGGAVEVVGNGLKPGIETVLEPRPLARGEVTVGYFGYLAGAWFDWELIAEAARRRPSWRFYLIGYGGSPEGIELPASVRLLGKQPQADLAAYAANWDVAVIPFKPDRLAAGADPIKTYEYLAMGLPVVTTGVHPPSGGEGLVARAEGSADFVREIERAARCGRAEDVAARRAFAGSCTWDHRLGALLASLAAGRQRVAEKRALFGERPGERP